MKHIPKIVVLGSASVGKTSIISRIIGDTFPNAPSPTTGAGYVSYKPPNFGGKEIGIWDTAGMERYRAISPMYYKYAVGAILVFDLTSMESFEDLDSWLTSLLSEAQRQPFIVLVGNKSDKSSEIVVKQEQIQQFRNQHPEIPYFEASALTGNGIKPMFNELINGLPTVNEQVTTLQPNDQSSCC